MKRIVAGPRAVMEALYSGAHKIAVVYLAQGYQSKKNLLHIEKLAIKNRVICEERSRGCLDKLAKNQRHQDVIAIGGDYCYLDMETLLPRESAPLLLIALDQITDPHNFGAIVRSAVALGADGIVILKDRASRVTPTVVRTSAGATEHAKIARVTNLARTLKALRERGMQIIGLDAAGIKELSAIPCAAQGRVLVVGSEGSGLRRLTKENCDVLAKIPLPGPISSLNASVAAAIALYESDRMRRQQLAIDGRG
ncbi:MAG: 23S rRNA (guanosine(2251)-2'-O)-methyltransferase RlmB [Deltaproteobacteria bacterium]|nr:23S rRNA (guanosine(2251)-2'-O)-methyltransferase RlmB [Deltaproteobacteria bacterium]